MTASESERYERLLKFDEENVTHLSAERYFGRKGLDLESYKSQSVYANSREFDGDPRTSELVKMTRFVLIAKARERGLEHITDVDTRIYGDTVIIDATGWRKK